MYQQEALGAGSDEEEEEVIDVSDLPSQTPPTATMTTTVVIDPPEDQMEPQQVRLSLYSDWSFVRWQSFFAILFSPRKIGRYH